MERHARKPLEVNSSRYAQYILPIYSQYPASNEVFEEPKMCSKAGNLNSDFCGAFWASGLEVRYSIYSSPRAEGHEPRYFLYHYNNYKSLTALLSASRRSSTLRNMLSRSRGEPESNAHTDVREDAVGLPKSAGGQHEKPQHHMHMPGFNRNGHKIIKGIHPDGESGRGGVHPWHFPRICFRSSSRLSLVVNVLWPFVPAAIAIHFARPDLHLWIFILNYVAMVPTANLVGFAGQELARKLPKVLGEPTVVLFC